MRKTFFLNRFLAILTMAAMMITVSCSEDDTADLLVDEDDTTVNPDDENDDDDDDTINPDDDDETLDNESLDTFLELIQDNAALESTVEVVAALQAADAAIASNPSDIATVIADHAAAVAEAEEGFVITYIKNSYYTLTMSYRVADGDVQTLVVTKNGRTIKVTDNVDASVIVIKVDGDVEYTLPRGYAKNITSLSAVSKKVSLIPGYGTIVSLAIATEDDAAVDGYINHYSGVSFYSDVITKSDMPAISADILRAVGSETDAAANTLKLTIELAADATIGWGAIAIQYGGDIITESIPVTPDDIAVTQSIAYGTGATDPTNYVESTIDNIYYGYNSVGVNVTNLNLYFTGVDNSGDVVFEDVVLSEAIAIAKYDVQIYAIDDAVTVTGANLLFGTSDEMSDALSAVESMSGLTALATPSDYYTVGSDASATISLVLTLDSLASQYINEANRYLVVVSGATTNSDEYNNFVLSNTIAVENITAPIIELSTESETITCFAGSVEVAVESNTTWVASCSSDWITLSDSEGLGAATVAVNYAENSGSERTAEVVFTAAGETVKTLTVVQEAFETLIYIDKTEEVVSKSAGSITVAVTSNDYWEVRGSGDWFTVEPTSGTGDGTVVINYDENTTNVDRTVIIQFSDAKYSVVKTLKITQVKTIESGVFADSSYDYTGEYTTFNKILASTKTLTEMFGVSALGLEDLTLDYTVTFARTDYEATPGTANTDVTVTYSLVNDILYLNFPMTLTTYGKYKATVSVANGLYEADLDVDFEVNGYPITFYYDIENAIDHNNGDVVMSAEEQALYTIDEETKTITIDWVDHYANGTTFLNLGFISPSEDDKKYLSLKGGSNYLYTGLFVKDDDPTKTTGAGTGAGVSLWLNKIYIVTSASSLSTVDPYAGSILEGIETRCRGNFTNNAKMSYYLQVTFSDGTAVWYDTGYDVIFQFTE